MVSDYSSRTSILKHFRTFVNDLNNILWINFGVIQRDFVTKGVYAAQAYVETAVLYTFNNVMRLHSRIGLFLLSIILYTRMALLLFLIWSRTLGPFGPQLIIIHGFVWLFDFCSLYFNFQHSIWSSRAEYDRYCFW